MTTAAAYELRIEMTTTVPSSAPPRKRRLRGPSFALAIPSIVWYVFFFILPIVLIVWYSFGVKNTASGGGVPVSMGNKTLQNYRDAFSPTVLPGVQDHA